MDGEDVLQGLCDLCGEISDGTSAECNQLSCSFAHCSDILYHQACLDKFFRSNKLDKSRKTGYKCPRGCGKDSKFPTACPGRIVKSHPILPRNETKKNKAPPPPIEPIKPIKKEALKPAAKVESPKDVAVKMSKAAAAPVPAAAMQAAPKAQATKEQLLELKASLRREMGLERGAAGAASAPSKAVVVAPAAPAAWPKGMAAAATATPEPAPVNHTLASYFMLSSKSESKALRGAGAPAAAAATPAPAAPVASSSTAPWQGQQDFPPVSGAASPSAWPQTIADKIHQKQQPAGPSVLQRPAPAVAPPPPRQPTPPLPPSPPAAVHQSFEGTVGMEYFDDNDDASKMTKAQRKNLKRAERKNRLYLRTRNGQDGEGGSDDEDLADDEELGGGDGADRGFDEPLPSSAASELEALRDAEHAAIMEDMFVQALVCRKAMAALRNVQRLAFSWWQAAAAVQRFGGDLSAGVAWLLECGSAGVEDVAVMPLNSGAERDGWPDMDLGEELQRLAEAQAGLGVSAEDVQLAVVEALGDVPLAIELLVTQMQGAAGQQDSVNGSEHLSFARPRGAAGVMLMQSDPVADVPMGGRFSSGSFRGMIGSGSQQQLADLDSAGGGLPRLAGSWGFAGSQGQGAGSSEDANTSLGGWNPGGGSSSLGQLGGGGGGGLLGNAPSSLFGGFQEGGGSRFAGLWSGGGQ